MRSNSQALFYFLIYSISVSILVITSGVYWDDWVVFHVDPAARLNLYTMSGRPLFGHYFNLVFGLDHDGFILFRIIIYISFLFPIFILDKILREIREINDEARFYLVIIFAVFPVNSSRIAVTMSQYGVCYLLFFLGLYFLSLYFKNRNKLYRAISLFLFYVSFTMDSLQAFYFIVISYIYYKNFSNELIPKRFFSFSSILASARKYCDFLLLPALYVIMRKLYFTPYGLYSGYNKVTMDRIAGEGLNFFKNIYISLAPVVWQSLKFIIMFPVLSIVVTFILFFALKYFQLQEVKNDTIKLNLIMVSFGLIVLGLGVYPYFVVFAVPGLSNWSSRHQILMPLGGAFVTYFGLALFFNIMKGLIKTNDFIVRKVKVLSLSFLIANFTLVILYVHLQYTKDWLKQLSFIESIRENETIQKHTSFRVIDNTTALNATERTYNFYEFTGLMKYAFGNETRYASLDKDYDVNITGATNYPQYNVSGYVSKPYEYNIIINFGSYVLTNKAVIGLMFKKFFADKDFKKDIREILSISVEKV